MNDNENIVGALFTSITNNINSLSFKNSVFENINIKSINPLIDANSLNLE